MTASKIPFRNGTVLPFEDVLLCNCFHNAWIRTANIMFCRTFTDSEDKKFFSEKKKTDSEKNFMKSNSEQTESNSL